MLRPLAKRPLPMPRSLPARVLRRLVSTGVAGLLAAAALGPVAAQQPVAQQAVPPPPRLVDDSGQAAPGAAPPAGTPARRGVSAAALVAASAASGAAPSTSAAAGDRAAARPHLKVIEDDNVRIEETRVRGQVQRITVQNKTGGKTSGTGEYEIIVTPGGKDTSQDRGAMGQRAWSLFAF